MCENGFVQNHTQVTTVIVSTTDYLVLLLILGEELLGVHRLHRLRSSLLGEVLEQEVASNSHQHHNGNPIM